MSNIVEVRPIDQNKWHGKKGRESFSVPKTIEVLYDVNTGRYATGLTDDEAAKMGKELGLDLSSTYTPDQPHPYWSSRAAIIKLENAAQFYDTNKPIDYIKVKNMKASKFVANSEKDKSLWPDATHVIYDETDEVDVKASKIQKHKKAMEILNRLTGDEQINLIEILSKKSVRGKSQNFIDVEMNEIIEDKVDDFLRFAQMDSADTYIRASVLEGLRRGILTKEGQAIYYMSERIGFDENDAVLWFSHPDNQKMKVAILEKLKA